MSFKIYCLTCGNKPKACAVVIELVWRLIVNGADDETDLSCASSSSHCCAIHDCPTRGAHRVCFGCMVPCFMNNCETWLNDCTVLKCPFWMCFVAGVVNQRVGAAPLWRWATILLHRPVLRFAKEYMQSEEVFIINSHQWNRFESEWPAKQSSCFLLWRPAAWRTKWFAFDATIKDNYWTTHAVWRKAEKSQTVWPSHASSAAAGSFV